MSAVVVRPAREADGPAVLRIDRATSSALTSPGDDPGGGDAVPFADHPVHDTLVAELDGAVVGFAQLGRPTPLRSNAHVWRMEGLGVAPEARGQGVARALVRGLGDMAAARGGTRLRLRVLGHNLPARALYESEGFVVEGILAGEFVLDGRSVDDVLMARRLV